MTGGQILRRAMYVGAFAVLLGFGGMLFDNERPRDLGFWLAVLCGGFFTCFASHLFGYDTPYDNYGCSYKERETGRPVPW